MSEPSNPREHLHAQLDGLLNAGVEPLTFGHLFSAIWLLVMQMKAQVNETITDEDIKKLLGGT